jgi:steroid delta-isomerase-like uncharacterized protein
VVGGVVVIAATVVALVGAAPTQARDHGVVRQPSSVGSPESARRVESRSPLAVARRFYAAVDARPYDAAAVAAVFADDYRDNHRPPAAPTATDKEAITGVLDALAEGFPDGEHEVYLLERVGPDKVLAYWTFTGTNTGPLFGAPATGRRVEIDGTDLLRIRDGRIAEQWHVEELQALQQQLTG